MNESERASLVEILNSVPLLALGLGIGTGFFSLLWWVGGNINDDGAEALNTLDETVNFANIEEEIKFHKRQYERLEAKRKHHLSREESVEEMRALAREMRTIIEQAKEIISDDS